MTDVLPSCPAAAKTHSRLMEGYARTDVYPAPDVSSVGTRPRPDRKLVRLAVTADKRLYVRNVHDVLGRSRTLATLPRPVQEAFGRVAREAAADIIQHSEADHRSIEVWTGSRTAHLRITGDGVGRRGSVRGTGVAGLTTRLRAVGRTLIHGPGPDLTHRVEVTAPFSRSDWWREDDDQGCPGRGRSPHQGGPRCTSPTVGRH